MSGLASLARLTSMAVLVSLGCGNGTSTVESVQYDPAAADSLLARLSRPCELVYCSMFLDGGSIGGTLVGASGDSLEFCHDRRMRELRQDHPLRHLPREVFIGAGYVTDSGSIALAPASPQESTLVVLLQEAIDSILPPAEQRRLHKIWYNYKVPVDDRRRAMGPLSQEGVVRSSGTERGEGVDRSAQEGTK